MNRSLRGEKSLPDPLFCVKQSKVNRKSTGTCSKEYLLLILVLVLAFMTVPAAARAQFHSVTAAYREVNVSLRINPAQSFLLLSS